MHQFTPFRGITVVLVTAMLFGCSGGGRHSSVVPAVGGDAASSASRADETKNINAIIEQSIAKEITGKERKAVKEAMLRLSPSMQKRISPKMKFLYIKHSRGASTVYANQPALKSALTLYTESKTTPGLYIDAAGHQIFSPSLVNRVAALLAARKAPHGARTVRATINPHTGTGPYRQMLSQAGYYGAQAQALLPCTSQNALQPGDTGYVYMGGFATKSDGTLSEIEADLQYSPANDDYAPLLKMDDGTLWYPNTGSGAVNPVRWSCTFNQNLLGLEYNVTETDNPDGSIQTVQFNFSTQNNNDPAETIDVSQAYDTFGQDYNGWSNSCMSCIMMRTVSIAQKGDNFNSGSLFGNVAWNYSALEQGSNPNIAWDATTNQECINYPGWYDYYNATQECSAGPPSGAVSTNIEVYWTDYANQTVNIRTY